MATIPKGRPIPVPPALPLFLRWIQKHSPPGSAQTRDQPSDSQENHEAIVHHPSARQSRAREQAGPATNTNIAHPLKETHDLINVMLRDGVPHHLLIEELAEAGEGLNAQNLSDWARYLIPIAAEAF